jgi:hypothetical protein
MDIIAKIPPPFQLAGILHCPAHSAKINGAEKEQVDEPGSSGHHGIIARLFRRFILNYREWRRYGVTQSPFLARNRVNIQEEYKEVSC